MPVDYYLLQDIVLNETNHPVVSVRVSGFIISMTKLLDADWLRDVQLYN